MTEVQEKLLELLTDIDTVCKREGLQYYLCAETAHAAITNRGFHDSCCQASVAMTTDHAMRFMKAVEKENRPDRIVDSMMNNPAYPDFTVRYGDPNTTMLMLPYDPAAAMPCIAVTIHMIRYKPLIRKKHFRYSSAFWKACRKEPATGSTFIIRTAVAACHVIKKLLGEARIARRLFKSWCTLCSPSKKAKKISVGVSKYVFTPDLLKHEDTATLEGVQFPVFGFVDSYLNKAYNCNNFRNITPDYAKTSATLLFSTHVPYKQYLARATEMGVDFKAVLRNKKKLDKLKRIVSADNKKIDRYYAIVDRTEKRFAMYEKYMPMKKLLLKLHEQERYSELNELLKPYRSALWSCYKKGLGLCFDKEIFEITMDILRREGSYSYVQKLRESVPTQHWESMVVTDYKGDLVEIEDISELMPQYVEQIEESAQ